MGNGMALEVRSEAAMEWMREALERHSVYLEENLGFSQLIDLTEREEGVSWTDSAVLMLYVAMIDAIETEEVTSDQVFKVFEVPDKDGLKKTLQTLMTGARDEPAPGDEVFDEALQLRGEPGPSNRRSTLTLIKQWWKSFCNIPPFCGER